MVLNTYRAVKYLNLTQKRNTEVLKKLWAIITKDVCDNEAIAGGGFRTGNVRVGTHSAPDVELLDYCMKQFFEFYHMEYDISPYIKVAILHFYFVYMHPFCDGNGRSARILTSDYLIRSGLQNFKAITLSKTLNERVSEYYQAIDEVTIAEYGEYETWSRQVSADLVNMLNNQEKKPVIIGIDLDYTKEMDTIGDLAFVEACTAGNNVCLSVSQKEKHEKQLENPSHENEIISEKIIYPYDALTSVVQIGIRDNFVDNDTWAVREFATTVENEDIQMEGFAAILYKRYQEHSGKEVVIDLESTDNRQFNYIRDSQEYDMYSFVDIMKGQVDVSNFQNRIVLIGNVTEEATHKDPFSISGKMQGIILQASMVDALLSQKVIREFPPISLSMLYGCIIFLCNYVVSVSKKKRSLLVIGGICYVHFQLSGKKKEIAVLFVDIRGFTTISESLEPEAVVNILNEYLELIAKAVIFHTNFISNFRIKFYQDNWVERNKAFWTSTLAKYPTLNIYMEKMKML